MIAAWLKCRLKAESDSSTRVSPEIYWKALTEIARRIHSGGESSVRVDTLTGVPRFDASQPPGPVVERLIEANILEVLETQGDALRFVFDNVYEFFLAESDTEDIRRDRRSVVSSLMAQSFSSTATRISRIGSRIAGSPEGDDFLTDLIDQDYARALVAIQGEPRRFSVETRRRLFEKVEKVFWRASRPEMGFIVERLGYVDCDESRAFLTKLVSPWEHCPAGLEYAAAHSVIRLNIAPGVPLVANCGWFKRISQGASYSTTSVNFCLSLGEALIVFAKRSQITRPTDSLKNRELAKTHRL
jgi:hypothetical protein